MSVRAGKSSVMLYSHCVILVMVALRRAVWIQHHNYSCIADAAKQQPRTSEIVAVAGYFWGI